MKFYDLWSLNPGNLIGEYASQEEAVVDVRQLLTDGWPAEELSLGWGDSEDAEQGGEIATGGSLAALTQATEERAQRSA